VTGGEFSIGRGPDNDWVLPDPAKHLSKRHCVIAFRQGCWQVAGTSTNGTFINRDETPLEGRSPHTLVDGDRLILGAYEIEVRLKAEAASSRGQPARPVGGGAEPFGSPFDDDPFGSPPVAAPDPPPDDNLFTPALPERFDPLLPEEDFGPVQEDHSPAISDAVNLPAARAVLPDDWDLDIGAPAAPAVPVSQPPSPPPMAPQAVGAAPQDDLLAAFLRGAGLRDVVMADPARTMEQLGAAFRATVSGIRHALIARSEVKREFRIEATQIRTRGNNLLKFSANEEDALTGLLGVGRRTDMTAEAAITDALTDMRLHELATMTAMQAAVRALVARLAPDRIRDSKDQGGGAGGPLALLGSRKARAWDIYEALHAEIARGLSDDFDSVFGKRFALAYEQAMQELKMKQGRDGGL
jgi:type VI secretion system protein ImpI/type VI secretion system protein